MVVTHILKAWQAVGDMSTETWRKLIANNDLEVSFHALAKDEVMYIPTGHVVIERSHASPMIYGARKSFYLANAAASSEYALTVDLKAKDGNNIGRMNEVLSRLKSAVADVKKS